MGLSVKHFRRPPKAPAYCQGFQDRHGKSRWYFRKPGFKKVALPGLPWSPEFMAAYERAAAGEALEVGKNLSEPGTINALIVSYYRSPDWLNLAESTRKTYRGIVENFRAEHGHKRVAKLERHHVRNIVSSKNGSPSAANRLLGMLHILMRHAVEIGLRKDDPTIGVRKLKESKAGFTTWQDEHIAKYLAHHKSGTRAHLALMLLLCTAQRRGDVVALSHANIQGGVLTLVQSKTGQEVVIPVVRDLAEALRNCPTGDEAFLMTGKGKPFTSAGFGNWFRDMVVEAGLPSGLSAHGLRKAACRRLAEAGCTPNEIGAISGHKTLTEVSRYTAAASRAMMAERAFAALDRAEART